MDPRTQNQQKRETHADDFQPRTSSSPQNIIFFKKKEEANNQSTSTSTHEYKEHKTKQITKQTCRT